MLKLELNLNLDEIGLATDSEILKGEWSEEYFNKVKNTKAAEYLYHYMSASLATEFPYIPGSDKEAQGAVKIKRKRGENQVAKDLTYIGHKKFQDMLKSTDISEKEKAMDYFSLDESWNLCVAKYYSESENGVQTLYDVVEVKIPYRDMVSQYSVPFVFMMNLQLATHNANYVDAVADLIVQGSEIEFTIFDSITTDETVYTYKATKHTRTLKDDEDDEDDDDDDDDTPEYEESTSQVEEEKRTKTEIDTIKANVTKAKTWILEQETEYVLQLTKEYPYGESGTTTTSSESAPEGEGTWYDPIEETWYEEIIKAEWVKSGDTKTNFNPSEFLGLWKNDTGKYVKGAQYNPNGKVVSYYLAGGELEDKPVMNILSAEEQFYSYFEENVSTQTHAELMKYVVNYYKGKIIDISSLKSIFEPEEFVEGSYEGDFDVHDETIFITDLETLKKAFTGGYSGHQRLVEYAQAFLDMQDKYKVNALFAASVSITETSGGRTGHAVDGKNNWFNIRQGNGWKQYSTPKESIMGFGWQIAEGGYYYKKGNYTVGTIGAIYCPNTPEYPTQADKWIENTKAQISRFYQAAGIDPTPYMNGGGAGGVSGAGGDGYRQKYTTGSGKEYVEYLQYSGPWKYNPYMGGNMKNSGCSVTSVAVILSGFKIDRNPEDVRRIGPGGISITGVLNSFGLKTQVINKPSTTQVLNHLSSGNPVIINAGNGYWSRSTGHYFPVLEAQGNQVYVANVGSSSKTGWYDINKVLQDNKKVIFISK